MKTEMKKEKEKRLLRQRKEEGVSLSGVVLIVAVFILIVLVIVVIANSGGKEKNAQKQESNYTNTAQLDTSAEQNKNAIEEYVQHLEDGTKLNTSEEMQKTKTLGQLEISNIQLTEIEGMTTLLANVKNKSNETSKAKMVKIEVLDSQGQVITELKGEIKSLTAGEETQLNISVTRDIANSYDFRISEI